MKKKILTLALIFTAIFTFVGCGPSTQTFKNDGISITVNNDFKQQNKDGHNLYLESNYASISIKKEPFETLPGLSKETVLRDYTNSVVTNNQFGEVTINNFGGRYPYDYFSYNKKIEDKDFSFLAVTIKGETAFYLATFQSKKDDYKNNENQFKIWAQTIKVDNK